MPHSPILQIAVPGPMARLFDYTAASAGEVPAVGTRVRVPFGRGRRIGIVVGHAETSGVAAAQLKPVDRVLDAEPILPADILTLARWAAAYYHHPLGEVLATILPGPLRRGDNPDTSPPTRWRLTTAGHAALADGMPRAPARERLLSTIAAADDGVDAARLRLAVARYSQPLRALRERGLVEPVAAPATAAPAATEHAPDLAAQQAAAIEALAADDGFGVHLLQGVTGSGKTEVYLAAIERTLAAGRQALVLVPEIGLTPQLLERFERRLPARIAVLHSGLAEGERLAAWRRAGSGAAGVVLGTRSAVFVPLARPGLVVIDEEHDPSLKQQDGFRYHGRDIAVMRARDAGIGVVLGSATPSLETLNNVEQGHYRRLRLDHRAAGARPPTLELIDVRRRRLDEGLSAPLAEAMQTHLAAGDQVLLFLNRRGWAPTLICDDCAWVAECRRCDARMTSHRRSRRLRCHHCGAEQPPPATCPDCGSTALVALGEGTERVEAALAAQFPDHPRVRIDRDTTRRRGSLAGALASIRSGGARILLGTQMLAKGHDFPGVTLVGILDADRGLFGADFRAPEHLAQTILQVAGRAGRAERPGRVLIQSRNPEHPLLQSLVHTGYDAVAEQLLGERREVGLPPAAAMALLRAEAPAADAPRACLEAAAAAARELAIESLDIHGPAAAPMERLAGRYRFQLVLQAPRRRPLHRALGALRPWFESARVARRVRWSIDVDPLEMR